MKDKIYKILGKLLVKKVKRDVVKSVSSKKKAVVSTLKQAKAKKS